MVDQYVYPGTSVLVNKFGIINSADLERCERLVTAARIFELQGMGVTGDFGPEHLKSIHQYIFQDIYDWAGEFRTLQIYKGRTEFGCPDRLASDLNDLCNDIKRHGFYRSLPLEETAAGFSDVFSRLNLIHPFREGNGRTQRICMEQLALNAGFDLNMSGISENDMRNASIAANRGNQNLMRYLIKTLMTEIPEKRTEIAASMKLAETDVPIRKLSAMNKLRRFFGWSDKPDGCDRKEPEI